MTGIQNIQRTLKLNSKNTNNPVKNGLKIRTDTSLKKICKWEISSMKTCSTYVLGELPKKREKEMSLRTYTWLK